MGGRRIATANGGNGRDLRRRTAGIEGRRLMTVMMEGADSVAVVLLGREKARDGWA